MDRLAFPRSVSGRAIGAGPTDDRWESGAAARCPKLGCRWSVSWCDPPVGSPDEALPRAVALAHRASRQAQQDHQRRGDRVAPPRGGRGAAEKPRGGDHPGAEEDVVLRRRRWIRRPPPEYPLPSSLLRTSSRLSLRQGSPPTPPRSPTRPRSWTSFPGPHAPACGSASRTDPCRH